MFHAACKWDSTIRHVRFRILHREEGQDLVEYALLTAAISISAIAVILLVGPYISNLFNFVENQLGKV